jgi:hypothetical protein
MTRIRENGLLICHYCMSNVTASMENSLVISHKFKHGFTLELNNWTLVYLFQRNKIYSHQVSTSVMAVLFYGRKKKNKHCKPPKMSLNR